MKAAKSIFCVRLFFLFGVLLCGSIRELWTQEAISGRLVDSKTFVPISDASVYLFSSSGTPYGTATDSVGSFTLDISQCAVTDSLLYLSCVGYRSSQVSWSASSMALGDIPMESLDSLLSTVVVTPPRAFNPALQLMKRVIHNKQTQQLSSHHSQYSYTRYDKLLLCQIGTKPQRSFWAIPPHVVEPWKSKAVMHGSMAVPFSLREQQVVCSSKEGGKSISQVVGRRQYGPDEEIDQGVLSNTLYELFTPIDLYQDHCQVMNQLLPSPLGSRWGTIFYRYALRDTVRTVQGTEYVVAFAPHNRKDPGFSGTLAIDSATLAITKAQLELPAGANVGWCSRLQIGIDYRPNREGKPDFLPHKQTLTALFLPTKLLPLGVEAYMEQYYLSFRSGSEALTPAALDPRTTLPPELQKRAMAYHSGSFGWVERPVPLSPREEHAVMFDRYLSRSKMAKLLAQTAYAVYTGFVPVPPRLLWNGQAPLLFGPVESVLGGNTIEGFRMRLGGRTTAKLLPQWFLEGYTAYGTADKRVKYYLRTSYALKPKQFLPNEYPQRNLSLYAQYDLFTPGETAPTLFRDHLLDLPRLFAWPSRYYAHRVGAEYAHDFSPKWQGAVAIQYERQYPLTAPTKVAQTPLSTPYTCVQNMLALSLTYTPQGQKARQQRPGGAYFDFQKEKPQITAQVQLFPHLVPKNPSTYLRATIDYSHKIYLSFWGYLKLACRAGVIWGQAPHTMWFTPKVNNSWLLQPNALQTLKQTNLLADRFFYLHSEYANYGLLLNRIPCVNKLNGRGVLSFNAYWGDSRQSMLYVGSEEGAQRLQPMRRMHHYEMGVGVTNILGLFRADLYWRLYNNRLPKQSEPLFRCAITLFL